MAQHIISLLMLSTVNLMRQLHIIHVAMSYEVKMNEFGTIGYRMNSSFIDFKGLGYIQCAKECRSIAGCVSINYDRRQLTCGINIENDTDPSQFVFGDDYVFSPIGNWTENFFENVNITCDLCRKAVLLSSGHRTCIDLGSEEAAWTEVAQGKHSTQSSTYGNYFSSNAVNGIKHDAAITDYQISPYWSVDLGDNFYVKMIRVHLWVSYAEFFRDINIQVGLTSDVPDLCGVFVGPGDTNGKYDIRCRTTLLGRYVAIQRISSLTTRLVLSEVEVYSRNRKCP